MNDEEKVTYFGETDARNKRVKFGIRAKDRSRHMYAIGKTGMGKSTLLENLAIQDINDGNGLAFIDPHGKSADLLLEYIPKERINDVIYFAPFDMEHPVSFNVMEDVGVERRHLVSSGLMSAFKKIWVDAWSARMEYILNNILLALLEYPGSTLLGVNRMLADKDFRKTVVDNITDPSVKAFWVDEYAKYTDKFAAEAAPAIQNKVGQFVTNPLIRNIIGQPKSTFDIRKIMDDKKILIINLSKGRVGESNANLLGSMLITKIYLAAMSRAEMNEKQLADAAQFYLYVDEFQSFANESFADILSEARKYKLNLIIAHQYIEQMSDEVRAAVFGNVGTMCVFRVGAYDAEVLEKEFAPQFTGEDIVNLQKYQMYLKLMIDGVGSAPFSAKGLGPPPRPNPTYTKEIIDASRAAFARPRAEVEGDIVNWLQDGLEGAQSSAAKAAASGGNYRYDGSYKAPRDESRPPRSDSRGGEIRRDNNSGPQGMSQNSGQRGGQSNIPSNTQNSGQGGQQYASSTVQSSQGQPRQSSSSQPRQQPQNVQNLNRFGGRDNRGPQSDNRPSPSRAEQSMENSNRPPTKTAAARENDLRKAVSLNFLKQETDAKNDQKQARPENVAALRDALLSVMKEAGVDTSVAPAQSIPIPTRVATTPVVAPQQPQTPQTPKPPTPPQVQKSEPVVQIVNVEIKKEDVNVQQTPAPTSQASESSQTPPPEKKFKITAEVPEDVLKGVLDID